MHPLEPAKPLHDAQMCGSFFLYDEQQNPIPETIRPMLPNRMTGSWITLPTDALRIYFNLCIIKYFLNIISPNNDMHRHGLPSRMEDRTFVAITAVS